MFRLALVLVSFYCVFNGLIPVAMLILLGIHWYDELSFWM